MQTEALLARYRELGSTLEASSQVRTEFEEKGGVHWHRLYERCWCGYLTVPASFYTYDDKGRQTNTQEQAEKAYLLCDETTVTKRNNVTRSDETLPSTRKQVKSGRPKKHADHAERQRAYRERSK